METINDAHQVNIANGRFYQGESCGVTWRPAERIAPALDGKATGKFKMPSTKSFRDRIASSVSQGKGNKDALMALDYSAAHPSSLAEKLEQVQREKEASNEAERDVSQKPTRGQEPMG